MADPAPDVGAGTPTARSENSRRGRQLGLVAILAVVGAALASLAATLSWWSADYVDPLSGALTVTATGSAAVPELIPLALVGLAGFGAALATRGIARRVVGVVIALCGLGIAIRCGLSFGSEPSALAEQLTRPAELVGPATVNPLGPLLGLIGGLLLTAAGVLITLGLGARQRMSTRYDRGNSPARGPAASTSVEVDPSEWWKELDAGVDPTVTNSTEHNPAQNDTAPNSSPRDDAGTDTREGDSTTGGTAESPPTVSEHTSGDGYHDPNTSRSS